MLFILFTLVICLMNFTTVPVCFTFRSCCTCSYYLLIQYNFVNSLVTGFYFFCWVYSSYVHLLLPNVHHRLQAKFFNWQRILLNDFTFFTTSFTDHRRFRFFRFWVSR